MSGPIVRTGTTPKFWANYDNIFGPKKKSKAAAPAKAVKKAAKPKASKKPKKAATKKKK